MQNVIGWILTIISTTGSILNAQLKVSGFLFWIVANLGFMITNLINGIYYQAVLFLINTVICLRGLYVWNKNRQEANATSQSSDKN